ncbi:MAG: substrate-binding domain-containing protein [Sphaerochaetaceae bacterium]
MKIRKLLLLLVLVVLVALPSIFANGVSEKSVKKISICTPYLSSVTTKDMCELMKDKLTTMGYEVSINDSANDNSRFASDVETSVVSGDSAIIIVSADPKIIESQINEASEAGIPVFGCDAGYIDSMEMNATSDNYQMGDMISRYLFDKMGKEGTLVHLTYRAHPGVVKRTYAMEDVLKEYPNIKLLSEHHVDVPNQINNSKEIVENLLTAYPEKGSIDAILCAWDEPAIGATQALQEAGRDEVLVVGVDGNEQAIKLINQGTNLIATLKQDFNGMADIVAEQVEKVLSGEASEKGDIYAPAILVEKQ